MVVIDEGVVIFKEGRAVEEVDGGVIGAWGHDGEGYFSGSILC